MSKSVKSGAKSGAKMVIKKFQLYIMLSRLLMVDTISYEVNVQWREK